MAKITPPLGATLGCGCRIVFREGTGESPVLVVVEEKASGCQIGLHVTSLPIYDHRSALRPPTRLGPPLQPDYEDN